MDTYNDNWCSCLLFRNKQLTKELKRFEDFSTLSRFFFAYVGFESTTQATSDSCLWNYKE